MHLDIITAYKLCLIYWYFVRNTDDSAHSYEVSKVIFVYLPTYLLIYLLTSLLYLLTCLLTYLFIYLPTSLLYFTFYFTFLLYFTILYFAVSLLSHSHTPRSRVLLKNLTGSQLVNKFPTFYGT